jgi:hypothetical protein
MILLRVQSAMCDEETLDRRPVRLHLPFEEGRPDGFLLESEVLQQVGGQLAQSLNQSREDLSHLAHQAPWRWLRSGQAGPIP